jgi:hypothetical protein
MSLIRERPIRVVCGQPIAKFGFKLSRDNV